MDMVVMGLPYQHTTSGQKALDGIQKILRGFNCTKFGTGEDFETGEITVQFEHRGRMVLMKVSGKNYAAAWLKENPHNSRRQCTLEEHEDKALEIGSIAIYSVLRDWIKGQITAVEIGMMSFEAAFLSHLLLPNGMRVIEQVENTKMLEKQE